MLLYFWLLAVVVHNFIIFLVLLLVLSTELADNQVLLRSKLVHASCFDVFIIFILISLGCRKCYCTHGRPVVGRPSDQN